MAVARSRPLGAMAPIFSGSFSQRLRNRIGSLPMNDLEGLMADRRINIGMDSHVLKRFGTLLVVVT
jgi:hypothetical protein